MKLALQLILHVFCAYVGYWMAAPLDGPPPIAFTQIATSQKASKALLKVPISSPPSAASESGLALLTPESWAEAIDPLSKMRMDELPTALRGLLRNPFPDVRTRLTRFLFERWASLNLSGALAALRGISSPQIKERALWAVLSVWNKTDPSAAMNWLNALDDDSVLQETGITHLLYLRAAKEPIVTAALADQIEDFFLREKALSHIGQSWMNEDAKGALAALATVEPMRLREYLMSHLCYRDGVDHTAGLEIVSQLPTQAERAAMSKIWLGSFVNDAPQEAFQWLQTHSDLPELQQSADAVGGYLGSTVKNSAELREMAQQLSSGPIRDAFAANAAAEWARAGKPLAEAEQLLALCGPCIERDYAQRTIDSQRQKQ